MGEQAQRIMEQTVRSLHVDLFCAGGDGQSMPWQRNDETGWAWGRLLGYRMLI
jgi:hypothetical protein